VAAVVSIDWAVVHRSAVVAVAEATAGVASETSKSPALDVATGPLRRRIEP